MATAPFSHVTVRLEDSYLGRFHGGQIESSPLGPVPIMSRVSAAVSLTRAIRLACPCSTSSRTHSAPVLVLPHPRPERMSHVVQSCPVGGLWFGLAHIGHV